MINWMWTDFFDVRSDFNGLDWIWYNTKHNKKRHKRFWFATARPFCFKVLLFKRHYDTNNNHRQSLLFDRLWIYYSFFPHQWSCVFFCCAIVTFIVHSFGWSVYLIKFSFHLFLFRISFFNIFSISSKWTSILFLTFHSYCYARMINNINDKILAQRCDREREEDKQILFYIILFAECLQNSWKLSINHTICRKFAKNTNATEWTNTKWSWSWKRRKREEKIRTNTHWLQIQLNENAFGQCIIGIDNDSVRYDLLLAPISYICVCDSF